MKNLGWFVGIGVVVALASGAVKIQIASTRDYAQPLAVGHSVYVEYDFHNEEIQSVEFSPEGILHVTKNDCAIRANQFLHIVKLIGVDSAVVEPTWNETRAYERGLFTCTRKDFMTVPKAILHRYHPQI